MNNYNVNKEMAGVAIIFITFIFIIPNVIPLFALDCKEWVEVLKMGKCKIKVEKIESSGGFTIIGTDPDTLEPCNCTDHNRWWSSYKKEIEPDDIFIKEYGQASVKIIKKDTTIVHEYKCSLEE
jgi:hypothetical protein